MGETKDANINNVNQIVETRMPSAHTCITSTARVSTFLSADETADWNNNYIYNESSGVVYTYAYDSEGYLTEEKVKKGRTGSEYYLRVTVYGDGTNNEPKYLPIEVYDYPEAETSKVPNPDTRAKTSYAYTFHDAASVAQQLKTRTITYPTVDSGENGPGSGNEATRGEYYDDSGRLRWTQDGEGYVNYYAYHPDTGGLAYIVVDVDTDGLDGEVTSGSTGKWIAWSGTVPFSNTDDDALKMVTKYEYDYLGRQVKVEDAEEMITATAYCDNETRVYPGWDMTNHTAALPICVSKVNDDGLTTETFTIDPAGVTETYCASYSVNLPQGDDTDQSQADYVAWTRYGYNTSTNTTGTALLENVDRYHEIPSSGDGTLSTNFYRTFTAATALVGEHTPLRSSAARTPQPLIRRAASNRLRRRFLTILAG